MTVGLAAPAAIVAMLVIVVAGRIGAAWRAVIIVPVALGAMVAIGAHDLSGAAGFLIEPMRAWAAQALILTVAATSLLRLGGSKRWGLIAAAAMLALLGGHAAIVVGGLLLADIASILVSLDDRPRTLHASIASRGVTLTLLASDALLAVAVLIGSEASAEPLAIRGGIVITCALGLRCVALLGSGDRTPVAAPMLLGFPMLAPLAWLRGDDARGVVLIACISAAIAGMRWARTSDRSSGVVTLLLLSVGAAGSGLPDAIPLVPMLFMLVAGIVLVPELISGGAMLIVAAAGGASLGVGGTVLDAIAERDDPWLRFAAAASLVAIAAFTVGAFGRVAPHPARERGVLWRLPIGIVIGGALAMVAAIPGRIVEAIDDALLAARIPDPWMGDATSFDDWLSFAMLAAAIVGLACSVAPLRSELPAPLPAGGPTREIISGTEAPPSGTWMRAIVAGIVIASALLLAIIVRSASHGWL